MNRYIFFLILLAVWFAPFSSLRAEIVDRCVAVVNDDTITLSEVNEAGAPIFRRIAAETPPGHLEEALQQAQSMVIEKLIEKKIMLQEAARYNISVSDEEVDMALQRLIERNNSSMDEFREEIKKMGIDEQRYREDLREQILSSKLVNIAVRSKVIIPEEKIIDYYDTHYTTRVGDGGYYILQIGVSLQGDSDEAKKEARKKIERIRSLAVGGKDFKELARQYSDLPSAVDGGDIGIFSEDEMAPAMLKAVKGLKAGEISEIVEMGSGFQIFKVLSSQDGRIITKVPYESVKKEIEEALYQQEMQELYKNWMKTMREKAYIKIL